MDVVTNEQIYFRAYTCVAINLSSYLSNLPAFNINLFTDGWMLHPFQFADYRQTFTQSDYQPSISRYSLNKMP